jgi:DNA-binding NtrC family response regulator
MPVQSESLARAIEHTRTDEAILRDRRAIATGGVADRHRMVGSSPAMRELRRLISLVAPTRAPVLIEGESGTGKELVARAIHSGSTRAQGPFVTINCAAIAEGLIESTLFGHEKGAFTGASARQPGVFERASGGTLFLDEVSELRLDLQAKLLRVIQESELERVGGRETIRVDVRLVATSNRHLADEIAANRFRADLYYRLHVMPIATPSLRERREDIAELLNYAVECAAAQLGMPEPVLSAETIAELEGYSWPGNVRELVNATHRAVILANGGPLKVEHFMLPAIGSPKVVPRLTLGNAATEAETDYDSIPINLADLESFAIQRALEQANGIRAKAAKLLGISERTLRNRLNLPLSA